MHKCLRILSNINKHSLPTFSLIFQSNRIPINNYFFILYFCDYLVYDITNSGITLYYLNKRLSLTHDCVSCLDLSSCPRWPSLSHHRLFPGRSSRQQREAWAPRKICSSPTRGKNSFDRYNFSYLLNYLLIHLRILFGTHPKSQALD